jgi:hypothetical protein
MFFVGTVGCGKKQFDNSFYTPQQAQAAIDGGIAENTDVYISNENDKKVSVRLSFSNVKNLKIDANKADTVSIPGAFTADVSAHDYAIDDNPYEFKAIFSPDASMNGTLVLRSVTPLKKITVKSAPAETEYTQEELVALIDENLSKSNSVNGIYTQTDPETGETSEKTKSFNGKLSDITDFSVSGNKNDAIVEFKAVLKNGVCTTDKAYNVVAKFRNNGQSPTLTELKIGGGDKVNVVPVVPFSPELYYDASLDDKQKADMAESTIPVLSKSTVPVVGFVVPELYYSEKEFLPNGAYAQHFADDFYLRDTYVYSDFLGKSDMSTYGKKTNYPINNGFVYKVIFPVTKDIVESIKVQPCAESKTIDVSPFEKIFKMTLTLKNGFVMSNEKYKAVYGDDGKWTFEPMSYEVNNPYQFDTKSDHMVDVSTVTVYTKPDKPDNNQSVKLPRFKLESISAP